MEFLLENKALNIKICGTIDSSNSIEIAEEIDSYINNKDIEEIIFNFKDINYISSAGLRVILNLSKKYKKISVIETNPEVYEIFEMTGFTSLMTVKKALREISIEGLELLGEGSVGKVYRLDVDTIVKVFVNADSIEDVYRERELAQKAFLFGAPTAISFDVVKIKEGNYYGAVFEMIKSESYQKLFINEPNNIDKYIQENMELFKKITSTDVDKTKFPSKKQEALSWVKGLKENEAFDLDTLNKIERLVNSISDPNKMVHGDLHIKNLMRQNDEIVIIDMDTLGYGHQIFELSAIYLAYIAYSATDKNNSMEFLGIPDEVSKKIFYSIFDGAYADRSEKEKEEILEKCTLLSYINLTYKVILWETIGNKRYNHAVEQVKSLIDKFDTLDY